MEGRWEEGKIMEEKGQFLEEKGKKMEENMVQVIWGLLPYRY